MNISRHCIIKGKVQGVFYRHATYEKAKALLDKYGVIRPAMQKTLDKLSNVPVDIEPRFTLAERIR